MTAVQLQPSRGCLVPPEQRRARPRAGEAVERMLATVREWRRRARDRAQLAALDDRTLADIGVTRADVEYLSNKPFWRG